MGKKTAGDKKFIKSAFEVPSSKKLSSSAQVERARTSTKTSSREWKAEQSNKNQRSLMTKTKPIENGKKKKLGG